MDLADKDYVQRCRDGHPEDFRMLVDRYQALLLSYLSGRMRNRSQAEEATQESFVRAFLFLKKLRKPESFCSWLLGIAGRVAKEQYRDLKRHQKDLEASEIMMTRRAGNPEEYHLDEAVAALSEPYRQLILLRYYQGLSCREAAERLDLPLGTVTKTLSRAYALLRQELKVREGAKGAVERMEKP